MKSKRFVLPIIVISQCFCTSLWFATNAVINDLIVSFNFDKHAIAHITSAVQLGFIIGTLGFAILMIADRFSPSKVFFISAILGAICNLAVIWNGNTLLSILILRALTGVFLAGIYPVGMKIAADYYEEGLGKSLGFLVGALVLGTAFPHVLKGFSYGFLWQSIIISTSILALIGGLFILIWVPNGPLRKVSNTLDIFGCFKVFKDIHFRGAAFGYFGHMWELYAFWAFVPIVLSAYSKLHPGIEFNIPVLSFFVIAIGSLGCVLGGYLSKTYGTKNIAFIALLLSCICCLLSPLLFYSSPIIFVLFLLIWGIVVVADSPLFSTLVAQNATPKLKGSALTIVNCIGFSITIISIQLLNILSFYLPISFLFLALAIGPIVGLIALKKSFKINVL